MKKLGVLVLSDPSKGGTFQYTLSMLEGLQHINGWEITLYTSSDNSFYDDVGFQVRYVEARLDGRISSLLKKLIGGESQDPFDEEDAVLAPIYSPVLLYTSKPFIYTLHDLQELYFPEFFTLRQRAWRRFIHTLLTKKACRIICESRFVKKDIERTFKVSADTIDVIVAPPLSMLSTDKDVLSGANVREKHGLQEQYLFYPAQFWRHKNHMRLIEAFARISKDYTDCWLVLTGKQRDDYDRVFEKIDELGLNEKVKHIGYVEQQDLPGLYREAIALVIPSLFESVSIPVFESFQMGTPVAVSEVVALPEQVGDAGLLFDPLSIDAIESAIRCLLDNQDLRQQLSQKGKQRSTLLTFQKYGVQLENLLMQLV